MKKMELILHRDDVEAVIHSLHTAGLMEIINVSQQREELPEMFQQAEPFPEGQQLGSYEQRLTTLLDILKQAKPTQKGIKAMLTLTLPEKTMVNEVPASAFMQQLETTLSAVEQPIKDLDDTLTQLDDQKKKYSQDLEQLSYLLGFDFELSMVTDHQSFSVVAGKTADIEALRKHLTSVETAVVYSQQKGTGKQKEWGVIVAVHNDERPSIEKPLRELVTIFDVSHHQGTPRQVYDNIREHRNQLKEKKSSVQKQLTELYHEYHQQLLALREQTQIHRVRKEISAQFAHSSNTYLIQGWVMEKQEPQLLQHLETITDGAVIMNSEHPNDEKDEPPTYVAIPWWAQAFKGLLELFATPRYKEMDPSIFMGVFFVVFFGLMLGDAGYGMIILGLSIFGFVKMGKYSPFLKDWSFMGIWLGLVTTIAGILLNSFFGDFIPRFIYGNPDQLLYQVNIAGVLLPLDPLGDPLTILVIALICGIIHLNFGIALGVIQSLRQKQYKEVVTQHLCWAPLQIGGGILIGMFLLDWSFGTTVMYVAAGFTVLGIILLLMNAGPVGFFDITGYVGDWLSYARILALGLATTGMALAFNVVAGLFPQIAGTIGVILMPIIFVIAHLANLGLQALGAGVHSLRLQYVEFFNRFYQGGGRTFTPFHIKRTYTTLEKNNQKE